MEKYWLLFYPETFIWLKTGKGLIYNTISGNKLSFVLTHEIENLCTELMRENELYSILIGFPPDKTFDKWVDDLCQKGMAKLIPAKKSPHKPVSFPPLLGIEDESVKLSYLYELTFYMGGNETEYPDYYRQLDHPLFSNEMLPLKDIKSFLSQVNGYNLQLIKLIGTELLAEAEILELQKILDNYPCKKKYITRARNIDFYSRLLFDEKTSLLVLCYSLNDLKIVRERFDPDNKNVNYKYILKNENDFKDLEDLSLPENVSITPVYTRDNMEMFEKYVYMDEEDVRSIHLSKREVFKNQKVNGHFFGKLAVLPDGQVYGNVNNPSIGNINESIFNILERAFEKNNSWFYIREQEPCSKCVYQWLCPSPSNFEWVIGRANLCHVKLD